MFTAGRRTKGYCISWTGLRPLELKMGLRGMLVCYLVKMEIYLAAEIIIIHQDFFLQKVLFFYGNLNHFIVRPSFMSYWSSGGRVVKLLDCGARVPGLDSRDWLSPASKSRYG